MKRAQGFTVIELIVVIVFLGVASVVLFSQRANLNATSRDHQRKTAINAMYYSLEEVYHKEHNSYPLTIDSKTLPSVDPDLFIDPTGVTVGEPESNYRYEGMQCNDTSCQRYSLRSSMEKEADYIKTNR